MVLIAAVLLIGGTVFELPVAWSAEVALALGVVAGFFGLVALVAGIGRVAGFFGIILALVGNVYVLKAGSARTSSRLDSVTS